MIRLLVAGNADDAIYRRFADAKAAGYQSDG